MNTTASNMTDLWERVRQGDSEAMVSLYKQLYADLLGYGVQLSGSNEAAQDAINDIFLTIWDNHAKLKPVENVKAYLFASMRRRIFQFAKSKNKLSSIHSGELLFGQAENDLSHEEILVAMQRSEEIRRKVQKAMEKLTQRQRELIRMKFFQGLNYQQIETETGITMKTAYNTVYNAMKVLAEELHNTLFFLIIFFFC